MLVVETLSASMQTFFVCIRLALACGRQVEHFYISCKINLTEKDKQLFLYNLFITQSMNYLSNGFFIFLFFASFQFARAQDVDEDYILLTLSEAKRHPENVFHLNLRKQKLTEIPPEIFQFKNLKTLNLSKNKISQVSTDIALLSNLRELDLSNNNIELLPMEMGLLSNLKKLILGKNEIYSLPSSFGNLSSLEYLDLWSNNLVELPKEMSALTNLKILDVRLIQMNKQKQEAIQRLLPKTIIYFSNSCNCD